MKVLAIAACLFLVACAPATDIVQHGNLKVQFTQTQNQWGENVVAITPCTTLENGYCPASAPTQYVVTSGKLPGVVSSGIQAGGMVVGSIIIADGLKGSKSTTSVKQRNQTDVRASTVNPK